MRTDGSGVARFGASAGGFPAKATGSPAWHPSGKYLVFVPEKADSKGSASDATARLGRLQRRLGGHRGWRAVVAADRG